jgi:CDP-glycerol glycerophosphotransferase (TagB/SpsB family)
MATVQKILAPANWEFTSPSERLYTSDHVIDAYLTGKKEALEQTEKLIVEKLKTNINNSGSHTNEILKHLKKQKFNPIGAYLKINSWDDFSILLVLHEDEFLSDKIYSVYDYLTELEDKVSSEFYKLNVSICDTDGEVDDSCIKADGFTLKHKSSE